MRRYLFRVGLTVAVQLIVLFGLVILIGTGWL